MQLVTNKDSREILSSFCAKGKSHDFDIFKKSKTKLPKPTNLLADSGYQGIEKLHQNASIPLKKPKGGSLTAEQKTYNRIVARKRVFCEGIFGLIKRSKIFSTPYRNRRNRFVLRFNLACAIHNLELSMA